MIRAIKILRVSVVIILVYTTLYFMTSCKSSNLLTYSNEKYFYEQSVIRPDTTYVLYQTICYNLPLVIDEEYCYYLTLKFIDTTAAKEKRILNLRKDTLIVQAEYGLYSVWEMINTSSNVNGRIEILEWDSNSITIKENINRLHLGTGKNKKLVGIRTYSRKDSTK